MENVVPIGFRANVTACLGLGRSPFQSVLYSILRFLYPIKNPELSDENMI